ncbi:U-box domain-containing 52-like isoform X1 [Olea europaea subsp. europaea]|uniref:RING-type E3 ubiquitin transferase n=1 Tax=Olea europaea subsp. europaea TaxID=158383 RepID=A0A8S0QWK2_OLEEU|nr:U-box domain-containing 52-like isoform X1 [Olea europaea subsp. europaea]
MWQSNAKFSIAKRGVGNGLVAVAIDKDRGSQQAIRWTIDNLLTRGNTIILIHVLKRAPSSLGKNYYAHDLNGAAPANKQIIEKSAEDLFLTFHCFCTRKDIQCLDVVLEDTDVARAVTDYVTYFAIDNLILGASRHGFIRRLKMVDIPTSVSKGVPDFCTVYVISKSKISSVRNASRPAPFASPLYKQIQQMQEQANSNGFSPDAHPRRIPSMRAPDITSRKAPGMLSDNDFIKSPFARGRAFTGRSCAEFSELVTDISFISSGRPSVDIASTMICDNMDTSRTSRVSTSSESSLGSARSGAKDSELSSFSDFSSSSLQNDDVESEMRRLKLELQKTMEMYSTACKEALTSKQKAVELNRWRMEEERRLEEARLAEEEAKMVAETEKAKCRVALENAEAAQRIAELESQKRVNAELKAIKESEEENDNEQNTLAQKELIYRRYTIEEIEEATEYFSESRKVGEGGYGPVFKCYLDHTPVAVKILRPDAAQGRLQFQHEVEVLTCMRHPNMVILLGACPEYGCLIYEYMANGSLEDRLFRKGSTRPLSWQLRFRIAAEIATALLFLHQTKPEPLVHRDLKPGNILLDHNFVSKIGDVGLARLVPPSVADDVTQYRLTSAAGTFCYIDPEYQQTGMLGVKSDVYSFGIVLLQLISGKPAMGLTHHIDRSIEKGTFEQMLDPSVPHWPVEEALKFAKLALQCAELRRKDRPDLGKVVLPELNRLREFGQENMNHFLVVGGTASSPNHSNTSLTQEIVSDHQVHSGSNSSKGNSTSASLPE